MFNNLRLRLRAAWAAFKRDPNKPLSLSIKIDTDEIVSKVIADLKQHGPVAQAIAERFALQSKGNARQ